MTASGNVQARVRVRDDDGLLRLVQATGRTRTGAEHHLKEKIARRGSYSPGMGELSADSSFPRLVEVWLEDLDLEGRVGETTRELCERDMRTLVLPAFEHYTLREITISKVDRFLKAQGKISCSRAKILKDVSAGQPPFWQILTGRENPQIRCRNTARTLGRGMARYEHSRLVVIVPVIAG